MQKIAARKLVNRAILDSIKDRSKAAAKFNTGYVKVLWLGAIHFSNFNNSSRDEVVLVHKGEEVATGTFS